MSSTNVDPNEIAKFAERASDWWDTHGKFKTLHDINPLRLQFIQEHSQLAGKTIVDIGCGGGILTEALAKTGATVTGIDLERHALAAARKHAEISKLNITYLEQSAEKLAEQHPQQFDIVVCMELLEHVPNPKSIVNACAKLVKPGGKVFLSTLNRTPKSYLFAIIGAEYVMQLLPRGTHDYERFIKPSELDEWARRADLTLQAMRGIVYNPVNKTYKLSPDVAVNYLTVFAA